MKNTQNSLETETSAQTLGDVSRVSGIYSCSTRHVFRMVEAGKIPPPVNVGKLVRWRLRTGDPLTGVYDHIEAGCPSCLGSHEREPEETRADIDVSNGENS